VNGLVDLDNVPIDDLGFRSGVGVVGREVVNANSGIVAIIILIAFE